MLRRLRTATRDGVDLFPIPGTERKQAVPSAGSSEPPGATRPGAPANGSARRRCTRENVRAGRADAAKVRQITDVPGCWHAGAEIARKRPQKRSEEADFTRNRGAPEDATLRAKPSVFQRHICGIAH